MKNILLKKILILLVFLGMTSIVHAAGSDWTFIGPMPHIQNDMAVFSSATHGVAGWQFGADTTDDGGQTWQQAPFV